MKRDERPSERPRPAGDDDRDAFADATRDVRPIKTDDRVPRVGVKPKPRAKLSRAARRSVIEDSLTGGWDDTSGAEIEFVRPAVSRRTLRDLRNGRFSVEAEIDLHGMSRTRARIELKEFVLECIERRIRCVRVIHGKGARSGPAGPVLKSAVHHWLARWDEVLAYASARPKHGGNGAVYVLLRAR